MHWNLIMDLSQALAGGKIIEARLEALESPEVKAAIAKIESFESRFEALEQHAQLLTDTLNQIVAVLESFAAIAPPAVPPTA